MHVSGKIFIWLALLGWVGALYLTTNLNKIRGSWVGEVERLEQQNEEHAEQIARTEADVEQLESQLALTNRGWGQTWDARTTGEITLLQVSPATGELALGGLGTDVGLGAPDPAKRPIVVNVFRPVDANGEEYVYVGPFEVHEPGPRDSRVRPLWKIRAEEVQELQGAAVPKQGWRVRERVPAAVAAGFGDLQRQIHELQVLRGKRASDKDLADENLADAEAKLALRTRELVGTADGSETGLLQDLERALDERDAVLEEVDQLRRQVADAYETLRELERENRSLGGQLPGAPAYDDREAEDDPQPGNGEEPPAAESTPQQ